MIGADEVRLGPEGEIALHMRVIQGKDKSRFLGSFGDNTRRVRQQWLIGDQAAVRDTLLAHLENPWEGVHILYDVQKFEHKLKTPQSADLPESSTIKILELPFDGNSRISYSRGWANLHSREPGIVIGSLSYEILSGQLPTADEQSNFWRASKNSWSLFAPFRDRSIPDEINHWKSSSEVSEVEYTLEDEILTLDFTFAYIYESKRIRNYLWYPFFIPSVTIEVVGCPFFMWDYVYWIEWPYRSYSLES